VQEFFKEYLQVHGYWVLFIGTFLEGEAILIFAGFLAFQGYLDIYLVILSALAGSFLGDQFYFHIGRAKGPFLLRLFTSFARKFKKALRLIERYGSFVAFISRYTYGFRILLPIILGIPASPRGAFSGSTWSPRSPGPSSSPWPAISSARGPGFSSTMWPAMSRICCWPSRQSSAASG